MTKTMAMQRREAWRRALMTVAHDVGKDSEVYRMLGSVAWGRFEGEASAHDTKDAALFGYAYLKGYRDAMLAATRVLNLKGERALAACSP